MKPTSCIVLRPVSCLFFLVLLVLSLAGLLIPLWISRVRRIENEVNLIVYNINQELFCGIQKTSAIFSPISASTANLAQFLRSSLEENELQAFSHIQSKVAHTLFLALSTIPYISEVAYIGLDGLFFGYYMKGGRSFALYSNSTFSSTRNGPGNFSWYTQPVDHATGELYGEAISFPPYDMINTTWFQNSLNKTNVYASVETGWADSQDLMLLINVGMDRKGAIAYGFSVKSFIDIFTTGISFYNGSLILASRDGIMLTQGIPNTHMILIENRVSFDLLGPSGDRVGAVGNVTCHSDKGSLSNSKLSIWGRKYMLSCSSIEIAGLQLVYVLALPYSQLSAFIHDNIMSAFILLIVLIGSMVITICTFVYLIVLAARREMNLCGALIKQIEATRQAERKSMNKSLAFASASHDVRASLAGITGLIEMSQSIVPKRDPFEPELRTNLLQMEACSKDLLGILNAILDTTKIDAGKMPLEEEEFDIDQLLEDVVDLFHPVGMKKEVDVILDPYDGSVLKSFRVKGDRGKLRQILCNLLSNAVKFTSEGHVVVRAWARKSSLEKDILASNKSYSLMRCISCFFFRGDGKYSESEVVKCIQLDPNCMEFIFEVNDTGKGIPKEKQKSVFENYVQLKETSFGTEGTGLGLGIVQSLVRLMGGEIQIMDKDVGEKGTCFRFNSFFSICSTDISTYVREVDVESHGGYISIDSFRHLKPIVQAQSPKPEVSEVILLIQSANRSSILKNFMERHGLKVHTLRQYHQLSPTLKKIKQKRRLSQYSSSAKSDVNSRSDGHMSRASSTRSSNEAPHCAMDGADNVGLFQSMSCRRGSSVSFILIVIDTNAGPFREISRAIAEFRRDLNIGCCSRVVWLDKPGSKSSKLLGLGEHTLPQSDIIMSKPFHGSRLYLSISFLPEFRGMPLPRKGETTQNVENLDSLEVACTFGNTMNNAKKGVKEKCSTDYVGLQKVEEIEVTGKIKPLTGKKILVADDDPVGLRIATSVALQLGANASSCTNGAEALELVCKSFKDGSNAGASTDFKPFDCILMDCEMPMMNGVEATRRIRQEEGFYGVHIPIVALTAHRWGQEMDMMVKAGVDDFLTKPLNKEKLMEAVSKFVHY